MSVFAICCMVAGATIVAATLRPAALRLREGWSAIETNWRASLGADAPSNLIAPAGAAVALAWALAGWIGVVAAVACAWFGPRWIVNRRQQRAQETFERQLVDVLAALAGALRAGGGLAQCLQGLAMRFPDPAGSVLRDAARRIEVGVPIGDALRQSGERHPCREWEMFVDSTETLLKMGGQLAPMIDSVADTLRRRARVRERLMTLTAQGRAQGWVLGALPPFVLLALAAVDPHVFDWLTGTIGGWLTLGVAGGLELMALMWIRRLLRVDA